MEGFRLDVTKLQVIDTGSLSGGYYYYRVAAILSNGEVDLANTLKVFAPYRGNSIGIFWDEVPGAEAYRVYRRRDSEAEGSILIVPPAFFYDTGVQEFI